MPLCLSCRVCAKSMGANEISKTPESGISARQCTARTGGMRLDVKDLNTPDKECLYDYLEWF